MLLLIKLYLTAIFTCVLAFTYHTYKLQNTVGDRLDYDKHQYYNKRSIAYGSMAVALTIIGLLIIIWI